MTMALWAVVCVALFIITFLSTRERVQPDPKQTAIGAQDFVHLIRNGPWIVMFIATLLHLIGVAMRGGTVLYYFEYYVSRERLWSLLQSLGLTHGDGHGMWHGLLNAFGLMVNAERTNVASVGYSLFIMFSQFVTILGVMCATLLSIRFGKKAVVLVGFLLTTVFTAAFILLPPDAIAATFALELLRALAYAPTIPLIWAMFADVTDYAEWKTGRRTTGLIFATVMFALKAGLSFGVAIGGWLLAAYAYEANVAQTAQALMGIRLTVSVYPALFYFLVALCLCFYGIGKDLNIHIQDELAERRRLFQV
jgi:Na+/melibiose symporter-like transporter